MTLRTRWHRTWSIDTHLPVSYEVVYQEALLDPTTTGLLVAPDGSVSDRPRLVVVDAVVQDLHGERIGAYFDAHDVRTEVLVLTGDEENKNIDSALRIARALNDMGATRRDDPPIAIGGGVVADVVGLAASMYRRGIPYVRVPTTLLGLVDVSVAAKTGVNYDGYRNRLGSYSPPARTLVDPTFLATLPDRHLRNGMGEILKLAAIKDRALFELVEASGPELIARRFQDDPRAEQVIGAAIRGMAEELADNLWETVLRRCVDFGHSFSPLVEMTVLPDLLHGEAVVLDCLLSAVIARGRGLLGDDDVARFHRLVARCGLPTAHHGFADVDLLWRALEDTTRHRNGHQHLPLMSGIGEHVFVEDVTRDELAAAVGAMATATAMPAGDAEAA